MAGKTYVVSCRVQALSPKAIVDVMSHIHPVLLQSMGVTKRRGSRQVEPSRSYSRKPPYAHVQATNASAPHQRMPTTPHELQTAQHAYTHTRAKTATRLPGSCTCIRPAHHACITPQHSPPRWHQKTRTVRPRPRPTQESPSRVHTERKSRRRVNSSRCNSTISMSLMLNAMCHPSTAHAVSSHTTVN